MKQTGIAVIVVAFVATLAFSMPGPEPKLSGEKKDGIKWRTFEEALKVGKKENKMIVVDFYTDWCTWCKTMDKETYGNSEVIRFANEKLVFAKVNAESSEKVTYKGMQFTYAQLARAFKVKGYPATLFMLPNGDPLDLVPGYIPPETFLPIIAFLEGGHYKTTSFEKFMEEWKKKNPEKKS